MNFKPLALAILPLLPLLLAGCDDGYSKVGPAPAGRPVNNAAPGEPSVTVYQTESGAIYRKGNERYSLDHYKGKRPVLLIGAPARDHSGYQKFAQAWAQRQAEAEKHNLVLIEFFGMDEAQIRGGRTLNAAEVNDLRDSYSVLPHSLCVALVSRDGKFLYRENGADLDKVFQSLDEQP